MLFVSSNISKPYAHKSLFLTEQSPVYHTTNQIFHGHPAANVRRVLSSSRLRYFLWTMKKSAHMQLRFS